MMHRGKLPFVKGVVATALGLQADRVAAEVSGALEAAGIGSVLLKGAAIATWLYDDGAPRPYGDADVLVAPSDFDGAEAVLQGLGFRLTRPGLSAVEEVGHARNWVRGRDVVDLHHRLWGVGAEPERAWPLLTAGTERLSLGGGTVAVLGPPARALHVALHAVQTGVGVAKPLDDLARAGARLPYACWTEAAALARSVQADAAMSAGLRLHPATAALADRLGLPAHLPLAMAIRAMGAPASAKAVMDAMAADGWRAKARVASRRIVPTPAQLRVRYPFARRSRGALVAAYLWRLVSVAGRAPEVARAFVRARRRRAS